MFFFYIENIANEYTQYPKFQIFIQFDIEWV